MKNKLLIFVSVGIIIVSALGCASTKQPDTKQASENHPSATSGVSAKSNAKDMTNKVTSIIDKKFPGEWSVDGTDLKKGTYVENLNFGIADEIANNLNGAMASLYLGETRISNSLKDEKGSRIINYDVPAEVAKTIKSGKTIEMSVKGPNNKPYQKFYIPIKQGNKTIGVIGISMKVK